MDPPERKRKVEKKEEEEEEQARSHKVQKIEYKNRGKLPGVSKVSLVANFYRIKWQGNVIYIHHMHFEPRIDDEQTVSIWVKRKMLQQNKDLLGHHFFWGELLFTKKDFGGQQFKANVNNIEYTLTLSEKIQTNSDDDAAEERMQIFSIILRSVLSKLKYTRIRDSMFKIAAETPIDVKNRNKDMVFLLSGFSTNISRFQAGLMLNIDVANKFMPQFHLWKDLKNVQDRNEMLAHVENQTVLTTYTDRRGAYRFYRVTTIDFEKTPRSTFTIRRKKGNESEAQEEEITFVEYYKRTHNIRIYDLDQPLLKVVEKRRRPTDGIQQEETIYIIPELCRVAGLPRSMQNDSQVRRNLLSAISKTPSQRLESLDKFLMEIQPKQGRLKSKEEIDPGSLLAEWGITISAEPIPVQGLVISMPTLLIGAGQRQIAPNSGTWMDLFGAPPTQSRGGRKEKESSGLFKADILSNWAIVCCKNDEENVKRLIGTFKTVQPELKMKIADPLVLYARSARDLRDQAKMAYDNCSKERGKGPCQIILVILSSPNPGIYKGVKEVMTTHPVPIQVVTGRTLTGKGIESKCKAILQQIVCKMGGAPWTITLPFKETTMLVGIEASHSQASNRVSVFAIVATTSADFTQYFSDVRKQEQGQDLVRGIADVFCKAIEAFRRNNQGRSPVRIIVYRSDPGGRGALNTLANNEVRAIRDVIGKETSFAFIVVRKRGLARLFTASRRENPPPGTLVFSGIVRKDSNEFYLISHSARQGTISPTQYEIFYHTPEDWYVSNEVLHCLSFYLCHLYYNFMGTIAEPAPLRYASRLANL